MLGILLAFCSKRASQGGVSPSVAPETGPTGDTWERKPRFLSRPASLQVSEGETHLCQPSVASSHSGHFGTPRFMTHGPPLPVGLVRMPKRRLASSLANSPMPSLPHSLTKSCTDGP